VEGSIRVEEGAERGGDGGRVGRMERALKEVGFMGGERASHDAPEGGGEDSDGVRERVGAGGEERETVQGGVIVNEGDVRWMGEERADGSGVDGGDD